MQNTQQLSLLLSSATFREKIALFISTTGFSGILLAKNGKGGGTIGSIIAGTFLLVFLFIGTPTRYIAVAALNLLPIGFWAAVVAEPLMNRVLPAHCRRRHTGKVVTHDFNATNIDEVQGQFTAAIPLFILHNSILPLSPLAIVIAVVLNVVIFRFFDVKKFPPVDWCEKNFYGAAGVMLDDTAAGVQAALLWSVIYFIAHMLGLL